MLAQVLKTSSVSLHIKLEFLFLSSLYTLLTLLLLDLKTKIKKFDQDSFDNRLFRVLKQY